MNVCTCVQSGYRQNTGFKCALLIVFIVDNEKPQTTFTYSRLKSTPIMFQCRCSHRILDQNEGGKKNPLFITPLFSSMENYIAVSTMFVAKTI